MLKHLFALILVFAAAPASAVEIRVPVESPQSVVLDQVLSTVIKGLAEQLTGQSADSLAQQAPELFTDGDSLIISYGYSDGYFLVNLDSEALQTRLISYGIDVWMEPRPKFLLWAIEEKGLERAMIGIESHPVVEAVQSEAERFGVLIERPLMDLEDALALSPSEVWGGFASAVERASSRYHMDHVIIIGDRPERDRLRYWFYQRDELIETDEVSGDTPEARAFLLMQQAIGHAKSLASQTERSDLSVASNGMEIGSATNGHALQISYQDSILLMAFLDHLERASSDLKVQTLTFSGDTVELQLDTSLNLEAIDRLISDYSAVRFVAPMHYALSE